MRSLRIAVLLAIVGAPAHGSSTSVGRSEHQRLGLHLLPRLGNTRLPSGGDRTEPVARGPSSGWHRRRAYRARHGQRSDRLRHPRAVRTAGHLVMHGRAAGAGGRPFCIPEPTALGAAVRTTAWRGAGAPAGSCPGHGSPPSWPPRRPPARAWEGEEPDVNPTYQPLTGLEHMFGAGIMYAGCGVTGVTRPDRSPRGAGHRGNGFGPVAVTSRCGTQPSTCSKPSKRAPSSSTTSKKERR